MLKQQLREVRLLKKYTILHRELTEGRVHPTDRERKAQANIRQTQDLYIYNPQSPFLVAQLILCLQIVNHHVER